MVLILSVFIGLALDFAGAKPADPAVKYYASKYDHIDVEAILNNRRMVNYYSACILSKGPCPPEGVEFKRILPEALHNNCGRCTEKQATVALHAIKRLRKEYPKIWNQLSANWDPDDIYVKKFESTFYIRNDATQPPIQQPAVLSFSGDSDRETNYNSIGGSFSSATITSHQDSTTHRVLTSTNSIPQSFTINTNTKTTTVYPYPPSTTKTTTKPTSTFTPNALPSQSTIVRFSTTTSSPRTTQSTIRTSTRPQVIPNLIPINTFFTNPPIPVRPLINLNIGANIGATVSGLVRGLGALGTRFMETGADIADLVIKNFARPLQVSVATRRE